MGHGGEWPFELAALIFCGDIQPHLIQRLVIEISIACASLMQEVNEQNALL